MTDNIVSIVGKPKDNVAEMLDSGYAWYVLFGRLGLDARYQDYIEKHGVNKTFRVTMTIEPVSE